MANLNDIQLKIIVQGVGLDNLQRANDVLGKLNGTMETAAEGAKTSKSKWDSFVDTMNQLEQRFDAVFRAGSHFKQLGSDLTNMGQSLSGWLTSAAGQWGDYEFELNRAAGALGIFDTLSPIYDDLNRGITEVTKTVRIFPADEVAHAVYAWGAATGQTVKSQKDLKVVTQAVIPILQAAAVSHTDVETAVKGVYQVLVQYHKPLSDATDVTEKLQLISQKTALEFPDLINSFKMAGAIAPELGVSFEDMAVVMGRLGDMGIRGGQAGRALQQMFTKLVDPTNRANKELNKVFKSTKGLGKSFDELVFPNGKFVGTTKFIDLMAQATENMTDKQRGNLLGIVTTQNELRALMPLIADQIRKRKGNAKSIDMEKYSLAGAHEQFQKTFDLLKNSWQGVMGLISNTVGELVRLIGRNVAEMATPFITQFGKIVESISAFLETNPQIVKWIVQFAAIGAVVLVVAGTILTVAGIIFGLVAAIGFVVGAIAPIAPAIGLVVSVVSGLAAVWINNFGGIRDAITNVVGAVINLVSKLDFKSPGGVGVLAELGKVILPALEVAAKGIAALLNGIADGLNWIAGNKTATKVVELLTQALLALFALKAATKVLDIAASFTSLGKNMSLLHKTVTSVTEGMRSFISLDPRKGPVSRYKDLLAGFQLAGEEIKKSFSPIKGAITSAASAVAGGIASMATHAMAAPGAMAGLIASTWSWTAALLANPITWVVAAIILAIGLLVAAWVNDFGGIQEKTAAVFKFISDVFNGAVKWITETWNTISTNIGNAVENIVNFFSALPGRIMDFLTQVYTNVSTWVGNLVSTIVAFPGQVWDNITGYFATLLTNIGAWWDSLGSTIAEKLGYISTYIVLWIGLRIADFVKWGIDMIAAIVDWVSKLPGLFADWLTQTWTNITTYLSQLPGMFADWFGKVLAYLGQVFTQGKDMAFKWGTDFVANIVNWFIQLPGKIASIFGQVWSNLVGWWNHTIRSVSTWASNTINSVTTWFSKLPGKIAGFFSTLWTNLSTWWANLVPNISKWVGSVIGEVMEWFLAMPGRVVDAIGTLPGKLKDFIGKIPGIIWDALLGIGSGIIRGIQQGISNMWNSFTGFFTNFLKGTAKAAADVHSPSKLMIPIGQFMVQGLAKGVKNDDSLYKEFSDKLGGLQDVINGTNLTAGVSDMNMGFEHEVTRHLDVNIDVTSKDGTVNSASIGQIKDIFTAEEFVSTLEHMATVS